MNCSSVYIFKNKEDRQNIEMYQKLAEIIFEYDKGCAIRADNIARAKRKDKFYGDYDTPYMREKKPEPYFTTEKGDLFLWVSGQYCSMSTEELIDFVDMTDERLEILSKVMIGYTKHVNGGYWFEDLEEPKMPEPNYEHNQTNTDTVLAADLLKEQNDAWIELIELVGCNDVKLNGNEVEVIPKRILRNVKSLMRRKEHREEQANPEMGERYYFIQDANGEGFLMLAEEAEGMPKTEEFLGEHFVACEIVAFNEAEARNMVRLTMNKPFETVPGTVSEPKKEITRMEYYDILFRYFRRAHMAGADIPDNFWDWLTPEKEKDYFQNALIYTQSHFFMMDESMCA